MTTLVAPVPIATLAPGGINTIVAQTAGAAGTQTAVLLPPTLTPTATLPPTRTPTVTPSPTATFIFILATQSKTPTPGPASGDYGCNLVSQTPADDTTMKKNQTFTVSWKVRNTGSTTWDSNQVDFVYVSGAKMAAEQAIDLPKSVEPDATVTLKVDMTAPSKSGTFKTAWSLHRGKNDFCRLNISIVIP